MLGKVGRLVGGSQGQDASGGRSVEQRRDDSPECLEDRRSVQEAHLAKAAWVMLEEDGGGEVRDARVEMRLRVERAALRSPKKITVYSIHTRETRTRGEGTQQKGTHAHTPAPH